MWTVPREGVSQGEAAPHTPGLSSGFAWSPKGQATSKDSEPALAPVGIASWHLTIRQES